ncbi:MAG TPA: hypothetical protein VGB64_15920 [Actinomycetota bacterium]
MQGDGYLVAVYAIYALVAVGLTAWLARTLSRNGAVFLRDVFADRPGFADAVNRLLVVGFYMLNLGYAFYVFRAERGIDGVGAVQFLVNRLALLLVTLALIHFVNVAVFWKIRGRTEQRHMPPPIAAQVVLAAGDAPPAPPAPPAVPRAPRRRKG